MSSLTPKQPRLIEADRESPDQIIAIIDERKLDYIFNKNIKRDKHNSARALQNIQQLNRLGLYDDFDSRLIVKKHLKQAIQLDSNIMKRFIDHFVDNDTGETGEVDTEVRDSLLAGPSGKFAQVKSSWEVLPDG
ncbi:MAG: hypothetical protein AB4352_15775, partial [Hormoscilla sp.]